MTDSLKERLRERSGDSPYWIARMSVERAEALARIEELEHEVAGSASRHASLNCEPSGYEFTNGLKPQGDAGEIAKKLRRMVTLDLSSLDLCHHAASLIEDQAAELRQMRIDLDLMRIDWAEDSNDAVIEIDRLRAALSDIAGGSKE